MTPSDWRLQVVCYMVLLDSLGLAVTGHKMRDAPLRMYGCVACGIFTCLLWLSLTYPEGTWILIGAPVVLTSILVRQRLMKAATCGVGIPEVTELPHRLEYLLWLLVSIPMYFFGKSSLIPISHTGWLCWGFAFATSLVMLFSSSAYGLASFVPMIWGMRVAVTAGVASVLIAIAARR